MLFFKKVEIAMRSSRIRKYKSPYRTFIFVSKLFLIWYLLLFISTYLNQPTDAIFTESYVVQSKIQGEWENEKKTKVVEPEVEEKEEPVIKEDPEEKIEEEVESETEEKQEAEKKVEDDSTEKEVEEQKPEPEQEETTSEEEDMLEEETENTEEKEEPESDEEEDI